LPAEQLAGVAEFFTRLGKALADRATEHRIESIRTDARAMQADIEAERAKRATAPAFNRGVAQRATPAKPAASLDDVLGAMGF
jgi:hypothetical protein